MITEIGITAGDIWNYLDKNGSATLSTLVKSINQPRDLLLMSLGWLAREGHIALGRPEEDYRSELSRR